MDIYYVHEKIRNDIKLNSIHLKSKKKTYSRESCNKNAYKHDFKMKPIHFATKINLKQNTFIFFKYNL